MLCHVDQGGRETQDGKHHLSFAPSSIFHTLGELDPREKETEKRGGPVEELESIKLDEQHPEHVVQIRSQLPGSLWDQLVDFLKEHKDVFT